MRELMGRDTKRRHGRQPSRLKILIEACHLRLTMLPRLRPWVSPP